MSLNRLHGWEFFFIEFENSWKQEKFEEQIVDKFLLRESLETLFTFKLF